MKACFNDWDFKKQRLKNKVGTDNKEQINEDLSRLDSYLKNYIKQVWQMELVLCKNSCSFSAHLGGK